VGTDAEGNFIFISLRGLNPFNTFGQVTDLKKVVASSNPIIKASIEYFGGRDVWSKKDLQSEEPLWDYSGRKYKVRIEGGQVTLKRDVPGPDYFVEQFFNQYPQTRLLSLIVHSKVTGPDGHPASTPWMDNAGNMNYPSSLINQIARASGINVKTTNFEQLEKMKRMAKVRFIKKMARQLGRAPEEYRKFILESINMAAKDNIDIEGF
jgi:hypothetical protein